MALNLKQVYTKMCIFNYALKIWIIYLQHVWECLRKGKRKKKLSDASNEFITNMISLHFIGINLTFLH